MNRNTTHKGDSHTSRQAEVVEERHQSHVNRVVWGPGDTYQQVCVQTFKFADGERVEVIVRRLSPDKSNTSGSSVSNSK